MSWGAAYRLCMSCCLTHTSQEDAMKDDGICLWLEHGFTSSPKPGGVVSLLAKLQAEALL